MPDYELLKKWVEEGQEKEVKKEVKNEEQDTGRAAGTGRKLYGLGFAVREMRCGGRQGGKKAEMGKRAAEMRAEGKNVKVFEPAKFFRRGVVERVRDWVYELFMTKPIAYDEAMGAEEMERVRAELAKEVRRNTQSEGSGGGQGAEEAQGQSGSESRGEVPRGLPDTSLQAACTCKTGIGCVIHGEKK